MRISIRCFFTNNTNNIKSSVSRDFFFLRLSIAKYMYNPLFCAISHWISIRKKQRVKMYRAKTFNFGYNCPKLHWESNEKVQLNYGVDVHFLCFVGSWVCKLRQAKALSSFNFRFDFKFLQQALLSCSLGFDLFVVKSWTSVPYKKKCWKRASTTSSETDLSSGDIYFGQKN